MEEYIIANCTDTGKVRSVNEDSMATFDSPNGRVVVVCDGMGGQNAGDVASQLAVAVIQDILIDNKFTTPEEAITKSIIAANQAILVRSAQDMSLSGMGATCIMLIIFEGKVYYGSVGDSRIYYISNGMIRQLTKDQSYVQTLVDAGELTQEAAEHHKDKNQITNALGIEGMTPPVVCQLPITPDSGSVFLLCSDGLSGMISNSVMCQVVSNPSMTLQDKAKELVKLANNAGGIDNITVQLVEFPRIVTGQSYASSISGGGNASRKFKKSRAKLYWCIMIICLILTIGGFTYWIMTKEDSPAKSTTTIKTEIQDKHTPTKPSNTSTQPSSSSQTNEATQVKIIEKKQDKPKKKSQKSEGSDPVEKIKDIENKQAEPEKEEPIMLKKVDNLKKEKNLEE